MTPTTHLELADRPRYASAYAYTCARCAHEELLHPVFLSDGNAYGTGCAAIMLGLVPATATRSAGAKALKAHGKALAELAQADRNRRDSADMAAWDAFCKPYGGISEAITALGGFTAARAAFKASR